MSDVHWERKPLSLEVLGDWLPSEKFALDKGEAWALYSPGWLLLFAGMFLADKRGIEKVLKYAHRAFSRHYGSMAVMLPSREIRLAKTLGHDLHVGDGTMFVSANGPTYRKMLEAYKNSGLPEYEERPSGLKPGDKIALARYPHVVGPGAKAMVVEAPEALRDLFPEGPNGLPVSVYGRHSWHKALGVAINLPFSGWISNHDNYKLELKPQYVGKAMDKSFCILQSWANQLNYSGINNQYVIQAEAYHTLFKKDLSKIDLLDQLVCASYRQSYNMIKGLVKAIENDDSGIGVAEDLAAALGRKGYDTTPLDIRIKNSKYISMAKSLSKMNLGKYPMMTQLEDPLGVLEAGQVCEVSGFLIVPQRSKWDIRAWDGGSDFDGDRLLAINHRAAHEIAVDGATPAPFGDLEEKGESLIAPLTPKGIEMGYCEQAVHPVIGVAANILSAVTVKAMDNKASMNDVGNAASMLQCRVDGKIPSIRMQAEYAKIRYSIYGSRYAKGMVPYSSVSRQGMGTFAKKIWDKNLDYYLSNHSIDRMGELIQPLFEEIEDRLENEPDMSTPHVGPPRGKAKVLLNILKEASQVYIALAESISKRETAMEGFRERIARIGCSWGDIKQVYNYNAVMEEYKFVGKPGCGFGPYTLDYPISKEKKIHQTLLLSLTKPVISSSMKELYGVDVFNLEAAIGSIMDGLRELSK